jgi:hypothetical protein
LLSEKPATVYATTPTSANTRLRPVAIQSACGTAGETLFQKLKCAYDRLGEFKTALACAGEVAIWAVAPLKLLRSAKTAGGLIRAAAKIDLRAYRGNPALKAQYALFKAMVAKLGKLYRKDRAAVNELVRTLKKQKSALDMLSVSLAWAKLFFDARGHAHLKQFASDFTDFGQDLADLAGLRSCWDLIIDVVKACTATATSSCVGGGSGATPPVGGGESSGGGGTGSGGGGSSTGSGGGGSGGGGFPRSATISFDGYFTGPSPPYGADITAVLSSEGETCIDLCAYVAPISSLSGTLFGTTDVYAVPPLAQPCSTPVTGVSNLSILLTRAHGGSSGNEPGGEFNMIFEVNTGPCQLLIRAGTPGIGPLAPWSPGVTTSTWTVTDTSAPLEITWKY